MSTEFTRESALLPMNRVGNNLCSFDESKGDICHVYLNPDKNNISNIFISIHLMERGEKVFTEAPDYSDVVVEYGIENQLSQCVTTESVPYEYFEERDQRMLFRVLIKNLMPNQTYRFSISFKKGIETTKISGFNFKSLPTTNFSLMIASNRLETADRLMVSLGNSTTVT